MPHLKTMAAVAPLVLAILAAPGAAQPSRAAEPDALMAGFRDPPQSARPRVWWHWLNGNVTKDGIAKDLAWMKRVGIGGVQNFDADLGTPQIVGQRLVYMHPEWKDAFRYAVGLAQESGLEVAIASSPGWSETGGPWVPPADGLKKLVWSETRISGGKRMAIRLPAPPSVTGPFQSEPLSNPLVAPAGANRTPNYYADVAVLAYPVPAVGADMVPNILSAGRMLDAASLADDRLDTGVDVPRGTAAQPTMVTLTYPTATRVSSATLYVPGEVSMFSPAAFTPILEVKEGEGWRRIGELPLGEVPTTISFAPIVAREFRIVLGPYTGPQRSGLGEPAPGAVPISFFPPPAPDKPVRITDLRLQGEAKIDRFEAKAGFAIAPDYYRLSTGVPEASGVAPQQVMDLTARMRPDGTLSWTPPKGEWRIVRMGYSLLGTTNHPATAEATGLEVDKFDAAAVRRYLDTYLGMYRDAAGTDLIGRQGVRALLTDSIEVGAANWTPKMLDQFRRLRGYDPLPFLPALTGTIVGSRAQSDAFLYDYRRTLADLMASEHYGTIAAVAHDAGLQVYGEALEDGRPSLGDDMAMRRHADIPMAALWTWDRDSTPRYTLLGDMKGAASVAHVYGQNVVAAESMTSAMAPWAFAPHDLRHVVDLEFASGINRPIIHTSVHQPTDDKLPGLSLAIFGQYFNRHETWAEMARPWVDYIARSSFMLQQGRNFADVAYFYGEEAPLTALHLAGPLADVPVQYAYDFVNADIVLTDLAVANGELVTKAGARYKLLYLGGTSQHMTVPVLRRIAQLAEAGATIVGNAPKSSPSLNDGDAEFQSLVGRLWSTGPVTQVGKGRVVAGQAVEPALAAAGILPDFSVQSAQADSDYRFVHRRLPDGDIYFVTNRRNRPERVEARFRVSGRTPEIWRADTGASEAVSYRTEAGATIVPLDIGPEESFFVVFRRSATAPARTVPVPILAPLGELGGTWNVTFERGRGAPESTQLPKLASLSESSDPAIRYFSGVARYTKRFPPPKGARPGSPLLLDLGRIGDVAEVWVNGKLAGTAWHAPYQVDIGKAVRRGENQLEVRVANLWVNRLIGDAQPGATKLTWTALPTYQPGAPLRPAGLIGPVRLLGQTMPSSGR